MISILHGEDIASSDARLRSILKSYPTHTKLWYQQKTKDFKFLEEISQSSLFGEEKVFICQNFISQKVIASRELANINPGFSVIFWEHQTLTNTDLAKLPRGSEIEHFKQRQTIFLFLDSISPNLKRTLSFLALLNDEDNLIWNLTQRLLVMFLSKIGFTKDQIEEQVRRKMQPWQWTKIANQAYLFSEETLAGMYFGILKIDFLIKRGKSNLPAKSLIEMLFIKYLRSA